MRKLREAHKFNRLLLTNLILATAMLLMGLNNGFHPSELAAVLKDEFDLTAKTFSTERNKNGVTRCAMLWPRSCKAIRAYQKADPHDSDLLFAFDDDGTRRRYGRSQINRIIKRLCKAAKIKPWGFSSLRHAAATNMHGVPASFVLGHVIHGRGELDEYKYRQPKHTAKDIATLEREFFGKMK